MEMIISLLNEFIGFHHQPQGFHRIWDRVSNDNGGNRDLWKPVVLEFRGYENIVLICIPRLIA